MPVIVFASSGFKHAVESRRQALEQVRTSNLRRMKADIEKISKRETEYVQKLVELMVPVKLSWDEHAWAKLQEFVPIKIEPIPKVDEESDEMEPNVDI